MSDCLVCHCSSPTLSLFGTPSPFQMSFITFKSDTTPLRTRWWIMWTKWQILNNIREKAIYKSIQLKHICAIKMLSAYLWNTGFIVLAGMERFWWSSVLVDTMYRDFKTIYFHKSMKIYSFKVFQIPLIF